MNHNLHFHDPAPVHLHDHERDTIADRNIHLLTGMLGRIARAGR